MLSFRTKLSYGVGGICDNALYTLSGTYLLLYLTTVAGVNPAVAGTISAIGSVWEAMVGPVIGFRSDETVSRFGRRKPFLMVAAIPLAIITSLMFTTINAGPAFKAVYYCLMIILFWTFFSMEFVPYLSWGADLTDDYNERTVLRSYAYVFNQVGMLIGMVLPTIIVDYAMNLGRTAQQSWQLVGMFVGICAGAALLLCALTIHKDDDPGAKRVKPNTSGKIRLIDFSQLPGMFKEYVKILKLRPIQFLIGASVVYLIANTIFSSDRVFYMTYNLGMDEKLISLMMLVITVVGIILVPVIAFLARISDKKTVFMSGIVISGIILIAQRFIGVNDVASLVIACVVYSTANTCYWQLMPAMIYDVCEVDELLSGEKHSGAVISLQALSESLSIALGLQVLGIILDASGFAETEAVQPEIALTWVSNSFTLIPGIFMVLVFVIMLGYPVTRTVFERVLHVLELREKVNSGDDTLKDEYEREYSEVAGLF